MMVSSRNLLFQGVVFREGILKELFRSMVSKVFQGENVPPTFSTCMVPHDVQNVGPVKVNRAFHLQKMLAVRNHIQ